MARFPRIEALLGARIGSNLSADHLQRLVDGGVAEDEDLEFKGDAYQSGDSGKREVAKDVAAMANHRGGVIIVGIEETGGRAIARNPIDDPEREAQRINLISSERIHPFVESAVHLIDEEDGTGRGSLLVAVTRSASGPHGVSEPGSPSLRFPVRNGTDTRYLGMTELADRFRSQFLAARSRIDRLDELMREGIERLDPSDAWLVLGLVPEIPGTLGIDADRTNALAEWASTFDAGIQGERWEVGLPPRSGIRRVHLGQSSEFGAPTFDISSLELHSDGSAFAALPLVATG